MSASKLDAARASMKRLRAQHSGTTATVERSAGAFIGGATVGMLEHQGILKPVLLGLPTKPASAALCYLLAGKSKGVTGRMLHAAGDGLMGAYGYAAGKSGSLIAGSFSDDAALGL